MSFGQEIAKARKNLNLSQKELAARIKKEDGTSISPQYLNDIERDRRNPPSAFLLKQFAETLSIDSDRLYFYAGELPEDVKNMEPDDVITVFKAFRKQNKENI